jgi:hypothetical protein
VASANFVGLHGIDIGEPGQDGTVEADLIMILPANLAIETYFGKHVCVSGVVRFMTFLDSQVPTITAQSSTDFLALSIATPARWHRGSDNQFAPRLHQPKGDSGKARGSETRHPPIIERAPVEADAVVT